MDEVSQDQEFLCSLRRDVEREIRDHVYPRSEAAVGIPWSEDQIAQGIEKMKNALVDPYWTEVEVRETAEQIEQVSAAKRKCP